MSVLDALLLGVIQGLTEFLPVSSSGHLVVFGHLLGTRTDGGMLFEVVVHVGTLLAVGVVFWRDLSRMAHRSIVELPLLFTGRLSETDPHARLGWFVVLGTVPTAVIGLGLKDLFEGLFSNLLAVGVAFLVTGAILLVATHLSDRLEGKRDADAMRWSDALLIGIAQGAAITPGISRAGSTIAAGLVLGLRGELAARFSFLLSVPAILGALVLSLRDGVQAAAADPMPLAVGFVAAAMSGYVGLRLLLALVTRGRLSAFTWYLWPLGAAVIAWASLV